MNEQAGKGSLIELKVFMATIILLGVLIIAAGSAGYLIPAGEFVDIEKNGGVEKVYNRIKQAPVPIWKIALSPILCITGKNGPKIIVLIFFILTIGGSFSIMNKSGVLPSLLTGLGERFANRKTLFIIVNVLVFALLGSSLGILEEIVPMILLFVPLAYRMGWDAVTGTAIPFVSAGFGFSAAMFNPFTVGTAQKLADVPLFSGLALRLPLFIISTSLVIAYLLYYTRKIEKDPSKGLTYETDSIRREAAQNIETAARGKGSSGAVYFILFCFALIIGVVAGGTFVPIMQDLAFPLIALIFLFMGIGVGLISGNGFKKTFTYFYKGLADFSPAIILILMAASVGYLIEIGSIMDTMLYYISEQIQGFSKGAAALMLYFFQMLMNFFVPSGTGQAVLTVPILAPLGDLIGITRQTVVLTFQCGDGFSNLIWPTNPMMLIAIGLGGLSYKDWFKWLIPLQLALMVVSAAFILLAVHINYV